MIYRKNVPFTINESKEMGFSGWANVYGNKDLGGDIVMAGAFDESLAKSNRLPILWQHKSDEPIGIGVFESRAEGLFVDVDLDSEDATAIRARRKMKRGEVKGLSIDYSIPSGGFEYKDNIRYIKKATLWATSVVTFPMNLLAQVTDVKEAIAKEMEDFNATLQMFQMWAQHGQMLNALYTTLEDAMWDYDASGEEKINHCESCIDQFAVKYAEWARAFYSMEGKARKEIADGLIEVKAGRRISAASRSRIEKAIEELSALLAEETAADDAAEKTEVVPEQKEPEAEPPVIDLSDLRLIKDGLTDAALRLADAA